MKPKLSEGFLLERVQTRLLCTCEECAHRDFKDDCSLGFPTDEHRQASLVEGTFVFCKSFEAT
jgi:hypothetical protein